MSGDVLFRSWKQPDPRERERKVIIQPRPSRAQGCEALWKSSRNCHVKHLTSGGKLRDCWIAKATINAGSRGNKSEMGYTASFARGRIWSRWPDAGAFIILIFSFGSAVSLVECGVNFCSKRIIGRGNWTRNENEELYAKAWWITTLNGVIKISYTNLCIYAACMLLVQEYRDDEVLENAPCCW